MSIHSEFSSRNQSRFRSPRQLFPGMRGIRSSLSFQTQQAEYTVTTSMETLGAKPWTEDTATFYFMILTHVCVHSDNLGKFLSEMRPTSDYICDNM